MGYHGHYGMGWMMGGFGWIFPIFFIICIVVILYMIFGRRNSSGTINLPCGTHGDMNLNHNSETPLEILKKRYAKGEITKEEFEKMKKDIT